MRLDLVHLQVQNLFHSSHGQRDVQETHHGTTLIELCQLCIRKWKWRVWRVLSHLRFWRKKWANVCKKCCLGWTAYGLPHQKAQPNTGRVPVQVPARLWPKVGESQQRVLGQQNHFSVQQLQQDLRLKVNSLVSHQRWTQSAKNSGWASIDGICCQLCAPHLSNLQRKSSLGGRHPEETSREQTQDVLDRLFLSTSPKLQRE